MKNSLLQRIKRYGTDNAYLNHVKQQTIAELEEQNHEQYNNQPTKKPVRRHALCRNGGSGLSQTNTSTESLHTSNKTRR